MRQSVSRKVGKWSVRTILIVCTLTDLPTYRLSAQFIQPEDRTLITDFSYVTALAATQTTLYAATPSALVVYDRHLLRWQGAVGVADGYPDGGAVGMAANPLDDSVWLAAGGRWLLYRPFGRTFEGGPLPGRAVQVVLDRDDPVSGAWFQTTLGWYFVDRGGMPRGGTPPPPARRFGMLLRAELRRVVPAFDLALSRITRDERLRPFEITAAAASPLGEAVYVGTNGNGTFRVDPVGAQAERLPAGLIAAGASALALAGGRVCAGTDHGTGSRASLGTAGRRGVTCLRDDLGDVTGYEAPPGAVVGAIVTAVALTRRGVWAGSDEGLTRLGSRPARLTTAQGLPANQVRALAAEDGGVWVGTTAGIAQVSDADRPMVQSAVSFGAAVGALLLHRDTLWIGSALGLVALPRGAAEPVVIDGGPALRLPVVDLAATHDTIVVATPTRILWRAAGTWTDAGGGGGGGGAGVPGVGRIAAVAAAEGSVWAAGSAGIAHLSPRTGVWTSFTSPRDIPAPVWDVAVSERWVWLATGAGLVRLDRGAITR